MQLPQSATWLPQLMLLQQRVLLLQRRLQQTPLCKSQVKGLQLPTVELLLLPPPKLL